jgi:hypothetical protein
MADDTPTTLTTSTKPAGSDLKDRLAPIVGFGALIVYVAGLVFMASMLTAEDLEWARATYLLNGLEALAFAGAGFFFGREVNRQRAEKAEEASDAADAKADQATSEAADARAKGLALATAVRSQAQQTGQAGRTGIGASGGTMSTQPDIGHLKDLADTLFPA